MKIKKKIKYAIYKNEVGLYAKEYIDNLADCKYILGGHYVKKEDLPIVLNRVGGRCSFYPITENFVEVIEIDSDAAPLTREQMYPKNSVQFEYGWISPEGDTYNTGYEGHYPAAHHLCKEFNYNLYDKERALEENGWIKITAHYNKGVLEKDIFVKDLFITKKQADTLFDLGLYDFGYVPLYIENSELRW